MADLLREFAQKLPTYATLQLPGKETHHAILYSHTTAALTVPPLYAKDLQKPL